MTDSPFVVQDRDAQGSPALAVLLQPEPKIWNILRNVTKSAWSGTPSPLFERRGGFHPSTIAVWGPIELV